MFEIFGTAFADTCFQQTPNGGFMPERKTIKKAQAAKRQGKSASTQAGAFVHEAIDHVRKKKHGAKNAKQAIAIGLSEARRSGVDVPDKSKKTSGRAKAGSRTNTAAKKASGEKKTATKRASSTTSKSRIAAKKVSPTRSKAAVKRLQGEPTNSVSHAALSRHAKKAAQARSKEDLHASALKAARTRAKHAR